MAKILYNVTIKIETPLYSEWLSWMERTHIPEVMATECFESYRIVKILGDDDEHGVGCAIQYVCPSLEKFEHYQAHFAKKLQENHSDRYKNKYVAFRTLMEIIGEG
jgi:hypothetical protein